MKKITRATLVLILSLPLTNLFAQETEKKTTPVKFLMGVAFEFGGDKVGEVVFTNGDTQAINAGQGVSFAVGTQIQFPKAEKFLLRASVGYKYVTTAADNVHIRLTRVPIQLTANVMAAPKVRLGAGLVMHKNIKLKTDGLGEDATFQGTNGAIFEIAYSGVGLSYTAMKYKDAGVTYSANAIGITISGAFPRR